MIAREGYPFESHSVTTDDGYILKVLKIQLFNFNLHSKMPFTTFLTTLLQGLRLRSRNNCCVCAGGGEGGRGDQNTVKTGSCVKPKS